MSATKRFQDAHLAQDGSADLSGLVRLPPTNAYFHLNGVNSSVNYCVNYVKSCVSLSTSQVSVCTVPSLSSSSKSVLEVGSHLSQVPNSSTFCLSESNAQRSLQSCFPIPCRIQDIFIPEQGRPIEGLYRQFGDFQY